MYHLLGRTPHFAVGLQGMIQHPCASFCVCPEGLTMLFTTQCRQEMGLEGKLGGG